ncbi:MAG: DUF433 domain-containing protein [Flavobacteriales bacterium]|nr:DUF433 domain-containing protein [Flavobacteriales bacterium]
MDWQPYITSDKTVLRGKPVIKGTRISVELVLELMENGWTETMILESYPHLKKIQLRAVYALKARA